MTKPGTALLVCIGLVWCAAGLSAQVLPADRTTVWNPGLNSVGGIPARTTIYKTLSPSGGDDSAAIQAALDACPPGQVVKLSTGTFTVNDYLLIHSAITLRGSSPSSTILQKTNGAVAGEDHHGEDAQPIVIVGPNRWPGTDDTTSKNLTANGVKGSLSVTVANGSGFAAGQFVLLDADEYDAASWTVLPNRNGAPTSVKIWSSDRAVFMRHNPTEDFIDDPFPDSLTWFSRAGRPIAEVKQVQSVSGNVITFTSPLHIDYPTSKASQLTRYADTHVQNAGVEDLRTTGASDGSIRFEAAAYCWAKDVEIS
ncbi:MAG TPA: pectate lyase, partial [Thermoanaerobaculia bacterium]